MTRKTINVGQAQIGSGQNAGHCRRYMFLDKRGDGPIENDTEALRIDIPAHDVERVGPGGWPTISTAAMPVSSARSTQAAAPSPNSADATIFALVKRSSRKAIVQISTANSSTTLPGRDCARREAIETPETPPAQPRPNTGTRSTSARKPTRAAARASRLGVAMPVDEMVT